MAEPPGAARHDRRTPRRDDAPSGPAPRPARNAIGCGPRSATTPAGATTSTPSPTGARARPRWSSSSLGRASREIERPPHDRAASPVRGVSDGRDSPSATAGSCRGSPSRSTPMHSPASTGSACCRARLRDRAPPAGRRWGSANRTPRARCPAAPSRSSTPCTIPCCRWPCVALAAAGILSPLWLVGGLAWFSHIVMDLALGQGLRTS